MVVIGARFRTLAAARAALRAVRASVTVPSADVAVRPLGSTRYDAPEDVFLLAGRFDPVDAAAVTAIVHSQGGRVIERRTDTSGALPSAASPAATPNLASAAPGRATAATPFTSSEGRARHALRRMSRPTASKQDEGRAQRRRRPSPPVRVRTTRGQVEE
jgi:hypothetical protein